MEQQELVQIVHNQTVVSSVDVAKNYEKRHSHVIRDIEVYKDRIPNWADFFHEDKYRDSYGREQKRYLMNRDGFSLLVMSFTGAKAIAWKMKYIEAFNQMEAELAKTEMSPTRRAALELARELIDSK